MTDLARKLMEANGDLTKMLIEPTADTPGVRRGFADGAIYFEVVLNDAEAPIFKSSSIEEAAHVANSWKEVRWAPAYLPRGFNYHSDDKVKLVMACGVSIESAVIALAYSLGRDGHEVKVNNVDFADGAFEARATFAGDGMKVWGLCIPGGFIVTGWK